MSSEASLEMVDVIKQDAPSFGSNYPSQLPEQSTDVLEPLEQQHSIRSSHTPTPCTSGLIPSDASADAPKVELEQYRGATEEYSVSNDRADGGRAQEIDRLKSLLESYRVKIAQLEDTNKSLEDKLSTRVCV